MEENGLPYTLNLALAAQQSATNQLNEACRHTTARALDHKTLNSLRTARRTAERQLRIIKLLLEQVEQELYPPETPPPSDDDT